MYRVKVVRTSLGAAVPLNKLDKCQNLLEESAFSLSDRCHLSDHIPFILTEERVMLKRELADKYVTEFWKITLIVVPETIRIFETSMVLLLAESTFQIFLKKFL